MRYRTVFAGVALSSLLFSCAPKTTRMQGCYGSDKIGKDTLVFTGPSTVVRNGKVYEYEFYRKNRFTIQDEYSAIYKYKPRRNRIVTRFGYIRPVRIVYKKCD